MALFYQLAGPANSAVRPIMARMVKYYQLKVHNPQTGERWQLSVREDRYLLQQAHEQGIALPASCEQGVCTTCAVKVQAGRIHQPEAFGITPELQAQGYALLCVSYPRTDLRVELQDEDEVYQLQFSRSFPKRAPWGLPLDLE